MKHEWVEWLNIVLIIKLLWVRTLASIIKP